MKIGKNRINLFILLFAVSSLLVHYPSEAFADPTFVSPPFDISGQEIQPRDVTFNTDGTKMFVLETVATMGYKFGSLGIRR